MPTFAYLELQPSLSYNFACAIYCRKNLFLSISDEPGGLCVLSARHVSQVCQTKYSANWPAAVPVIVAFFFIVSEAIKQ